MHFIHLASLLVTGLTSCTLAVAIPQPGDASLSQRSPEALRVHVGVMIPGKEWKPSEKRAIDERDAEADPYVVVGQDWKPGQ